MLETETAVDGLLSVQIWVAAPVPVLMLNSWLAVVIEMAPVPAWPTP